jgi:hypothetical protein
MWGPVVFSVLGGFVIVGIVLFCCLSSLIQVAKYMWDEIHDLWQDVCTIWKKKEDTHK